MLVLSALMVIHNKLLFNKNDNFSLLLLLDAIITPTPSPG